MLIENIISAIVLAVGLGLVSGAIYGFRAGRRRKAWLFVAAAVLYIPVLITLASVSESFAEVSPHHPLWSSVR